MDKRTLAILLTLWGTANFLPHLVVFLITGGMQYRLSPIWGITAEWSIMILNLLLPLAANRFLLREGGNRATDFGWHWRGWSTPAYAASGLGVVLLIVLGTQRLFGAPVPSPAQNFSSIMELLLLLLLLLGITAPAEETMFRGWLQQHFVGAFGVPKGIALTALLFVCRYLPMDLYAGISLHLPSSAWISRVIQLFSLALILGVVRHYSRSTWSSWLLREAVLLLAVLLAVLAGLG